MKGKKKEKKEQASEMGFLGHLEELRKRIFYSILGVIAGSAIAWYFNDFIMNNILLRQAIDSGLKLQNLRPFGQLFLYFKVFLTIGVIISFPFILYQIWKFIAPGLYKAERAWVRAITFFTTICFLAGVAFAYFVMIPTMLNFAANFGTKEIANQIDINEYFSFITMIILGAGLLFELPVVTFILSRIGVLTPDFMKKYRRHSIVLILIIAAVITPTPDPVTQLVFAVPLYFLYELSIIISKAASKKYKAAHAQET